MIKKSLLLTLFLSFLSTKAQDRPKLVVGIVVDQMKMEYLYRFYDDFSAEGFKRLMNDGYTFHNTHYNYVPTFTAPGHASIYTGTTPATHGIVSNEWFNKSLGKEMYCTDDINAKTLVEGTEKEGAMSPKNLQSTTITDELRLATNFKGKVIGVSIKDRGAILPAGHFANWAFWYAKTGDFISSSFYGEKLPDWVIRFNNDKKWKSYLNKDWKLLKTASVYNKSLPDNNPYEGKLDKTKDPVFPYDLSKIAAEKGPDLLRGVPFGNDFLCDFAIKAIEKEDLGKDEITDFLALSFSSTDYVGHQFGPRSVEVQDTYLRLDETLATFLKALDKNVGKNNYLIFLTADHAGAENPQFLNDNKYNVKNISTKEITASLRKFSTDTFGTDLVLNYSSFNLFLNKETIKSKGLELSKVKQSFKDFLMLQDYVKNAYTENEIMSPVEKDYDLGFVARGYDPKQNGEIVIVEKTGYLEGYGTGTTHGTLNSYDTHVPLIFYGWKIPKGEFHGKTKITQIAPTLSQLLKITFPNGTESEVLENLFEKK